MAEFTIVNGTLTDYSGNESEINIPESVTKIGMWAFHNCTGLTKINIPHGISELDLSFVSGCESLSRINIPSSVKKLSMYIFDFPKNLKQIIIDPDTELEETEWPDKLLGHEFEISPIPMIPIASIKYPETKLDFFFEYCKDPSKYPPHIAEGYEKYGKSQRSRILREAEAQNKTEVIDYYAKKGYKASERTLSPQEKAKILEDTITTGSAEDLHSVLKKHKTFPNEAVILEKAVICGDTERVRILLNHGIGFPEETDCFYTMLTSNELSYETKISICELCLSLCKTGDFRNSIAFSACILNNKKILELWEKYNEPENYLEITHTKMFTHLFKDLPMGEYARVLLQLLELTDPKKKPQIHVPTHYEIDYSGGKDPFDSPELMRLILDKFSLDEEQYDDVLRTVIDKDIETYELFIKNCPINESDYIHSDAFIRRIYQACSSKTWDYLAGMFKAGWIQTVINAEDGGHGWKEDVFLSAIRTGKTDDIERLIENKWLGLLPSSFSKSGALETAVYADNPGALAILEGWIHTAALRDKLIDLASNEKKNNALAWLLEYKNRTADPVKEEKARERKERKALNNGGNKSASENSKPRKITAWKTSRNPDGTYALVQYSDEEDDEAILIIPAVLGKKQITTIRKDTFLRAVEYGNIYEKRIIVISDGITEIEDMVFDGFVWLKAIAIPESVTMIGKNAFQGCDDTVIYGKTGSYAQTYANESGMRFIANDLSSTSIPEFVIYEDTLIAYSGDDKNPVIPNSVKKIGENVFADRNDIESIIIPDGLTSIGEAAFENCSGLQKISIPEGVTSIGNSAFKGCTELKSIDIPDSVTNIGGGAFSGCSALTGIVLPKGITKIDDASAYCYNGGVFENCSRLFSITIPQGVTSIGRNAFKGCSRLQRVTIPDSVTNIGDGAFIGCPNLWTEGSEFLIINTFLVDYKGKESEVIIPDKVETIRKNVFTDHKEIISITIPDSVTNIEDYAFKGCNGLTDITLSKNLKTLGSNVFQGCTSLMKDGEIFLIINNSLEIYNGTDSEVIIPSGVTVIQESVFADHEEIFSVTIPDSVTKIGKYAFYKCENLRKVIIPEGVTEIGMNAFCNCKSLANVTISKSVIEIEDAFYGCLKSKLTFYVYAGSKGLEYAVKSGFKYKVIKE